MIYLVRHAHAVDSVDDDARALSPEGRAQVRRLAAFLGASGEMQPAEIWHSPLVRACETATLLAGALGLRVPLRKVAGLRPGDDPATMAARLQSPLSMALVGHEPNLSALASLLVAGRAAPAVFHLGKCAALALERTRPGNAACWAVCWQVAAELLP
jgi:phosphohistidine phosphatase